MIFLVEIGILFFLLKKRYKGGNFLFITFFENVFTFFDILREVF